MRRVVKIQTMDGILHDTESSAKHYADVMYTSAICVLASAIGQLTKYQDIKDYIHQNLDKFVAAKQLRDDMELEES
jgi:hypothetical protein